MKKGMSMMVVVILGLIFLAVVLFSAKPLVKYVESQFGEGGLLSFKAKDAGVISSPKVAEVKVPAVPTIEIKGAWEDMRNQLVNEIVGCWNAAERSEQNKKWAELRFYIPTGSVPPEGIAGTYAGGEKSFVITLSSIEKLLRPKNQKVFEALSSSFKAKNIQLGYSLNGKEKYVSYLLCCTHNTIGANEIFITSDLNYKCE